MKTEGDWVERFVSAVGSAVSLERDAPAGALCTWRVGGPLRVVVRPNSRSELMTLAEALPEGLPTLVIGRGSNLLVSDRGFDGVCVMLGSDFESIEMLLPPGAGVDAGADAVVVSGGAVPLPVLARRSAASAVAGLEFYVGIPGSVGGAVRMNAGGHGQTTAEVLLDCEVFDLANASLNTIAAHELRFDYRSSAIRPTQVVTSARFRGVLDLRDACERRIDDVVAWRRAHQPGGANAGSVFANPHGDSAGRLLDTAGCKNAAVGGAEVSSQHAHFIQANPGATANDVYSLISFVRSRVYAVHGVDLQPEVQCAGFEYPPDLHKELSK